MKQHHEENDAVASNTREHGVFPRRGEIKNLCSAKRAA